MGYKFNPFTGNFDESGTVSIPDPLTVDNLTVNNLLTANHIHGNLAGSLYIHVKNTGGVTLAKGTPVYIVGAVGDTTTLEVVAADSSNLDKTPAIGLLDSELENNESGHAVLFGEIQGVNTGSYAINDELFLAPGGGLTVTKPTTGYIQSLAVVGRVHVTTGTILVWVASRLQEAAGSNTQIQFNDGGNLGGDADLTYNKTTNQLTTKGDINLDDGGSFTTTLQTITPTANRTLSFPDATGTVALVAGSSGQLIWNSSGAYAGASTLTYDGSILTSSGRFINSYNATASSPAKAWTGTWFTGGTATTTKPHVLIEPTGTTSTGWSTSGTGLGVNAPSGFAGNLLDLQVNGTRQAYINSAGRLFIPPGSSASPGVRFNHAANDQCGFYSTGTVDVGFGTFGNGQVIFSGNGGFVTVGALGAFRFSSSNTLDAGPGVTDVFLRRDEAGLLAQRNGTAAQSFRVYGTESSSLANYVRASLSSSSTAVTLAAESAGTGAANVPLNLTAKGTATVKVNSVAEVAASSTVAGLPAAPAVGMITRVTDATSPALGATVAGGGAAAALVWYNGAAWNVIGV